MKRFILLILIAIFICFSTEENKTEEDLIPKSIGPDIYIKCKFIFDQMTGIVKELIDYLKRSEIDKAINLCTSKNIIFSKLIPIFLYIHI